MMAPKSRPFRTHSRSGSATKIAPHAHLHITPQRQPEDDDDDDWESASGGVTPIHESESDSEQVPPSRSDTITATNGHHKPRSSRPPSSLSSHQHPPLRLHPLIRGPALSLSTTTITAPDASPLSTSIPRPQPLQPLTVTDVDARGSPESLISPASASTASSDIAPRGTARPRPRKFSFSSQRSTTQSSSSQSHTATTRTRTLSTLSTSSSAALSSLAQFPSASTRPPSPAPLALASSHSASSSSSSSHPLYSPSLTPTTLPHLNPSHLISFFPPINPHANIELIHPLLPHPYLGNHLTVLGRKVPMREALERVRVGKAKWDKL